MRLRKLRGKDAAFMLEWMHDNDVVCDLRTNFASKTIEDCIEFIERAQETQENIHLAVVDDEDVYMGTVSLKNIKGNSAEFGITIRKCAMGKGYSLYAMEEILKIAFEKLGLDKIYWCVSADNKRAYRFYDKNGYSRCDVPLEAEGYTDEEIEKYIWYAKVRDMTNNKASNVAVKASLAYTMCNVLQKSLVFITLPLFTRLLTTEQYGQYSVYTSWFGILSIFLTLNLAYGSFSTAMVKFNDEKDKYTAVVNYISFLFAVVFLAIYGLFAYSWNRLFELPTILVVLMILEIVATNSFATWSARKRFDFKYKSVVAVTLLMSLLAPIVSYIFVINSEEKGYARIAGSVLVTVFIGAILFIYSAVKGGNPFNQKMWKYALGFNIPLIPYYLSQVIFNQSDRIMISQMVGTDKAGIYNVAYSLATVFVFVMSSINNAYLPWFYKCLKSNNTSRNRNVTSAIAFFIAVMLFLIVLMAPEVIYLFAGEQYVEAIGVVAPVAVSVLLQYYTTLFTNIEFYFEEKWALVWATVSAAFVNIILNAMLIPIYGFIAAAYTTLFSYIIFCLMNGIAYKKIIRKKQIMDDLYDYKTLGCIMLGMVVLSVVAMCLYKYLFFRMLLMVFVLLCGFMNRNKIVYIIQECKR